MRKLKRESVAVILGTRPEIIKLSPVLRCLAAKRVDHFVLHTDQHYSYAMDALFFRELGLVAPKYRLDGGGSASGHAASTGRMMAGLEAVLEKRRPSAVLVQGDTNSVLAGALTASKIPGIRIGHVEAGLRSYDRGMPEEVNRVVTDHISDYLFAPTPLARRTLIGEGIAKQKIFMTGNTIVDAVLQNARLADKRQPLAAEKNKFMLLTLHRQENVDDKTRLAEVLEGLRRVAVKYQMPIYFPMHPRTRARLRSFGLRLPGAVRPLAPAGFLDFLRLEKRAELILTDSGGVQEEACILRVPCVTLRTTTERPETVTVGANCLAGWQSQSILRVSEKMISARRNWTNPFGDGRAAERIVRALTARL